MAQLFAGANLEYTPSRSFYILPNARQMLWPLIVSDNFNMTAANLLASDNGAIYPTATTLSLGIYSLTGATLTLLNSGSMTKTRTSTAALTSTYYLAITNFNRTINFSPGNYWVGVLASVSYSLIAVSEVRILHDFFNGSFTPPYGLVGGSLAASTSSLRASLLSASVRQGELGIAHYPGLMPQIVLSA